MPSWILMLSSAEWLRIQQQNVLIDLYMSLLIAKYVQVPEGRGQSDCLDRATL